MLSAVVTLFFFFAFAFVKFACTALCPEPFINLIRRIFRLEDANFQGVMGSTFSLVGTMSLLPVLAS